jgi:DivIVA domain-containing protein
MPLTPADVHNVAFKKPSIGKRGYDEDEVDAFLDVVEAELGRLIEENNDLTSRLASYEAGSTPPARPAPVAEVAPAPAPAAAPAAAASTADGHVQAARLLGLAQETADRLTAEAKAESDRVLADAKSQSDALITDASTRAEAAERDSRIRADALDKEAQSKYDDVIGKLADERITLEKKIEDLRVYEREYRGRLKSWISEQLAQLDGQAPKEPAASIVNNSE